VIYYFKCDYCLQKVGVFVDKTSHEQKKLDCVYCGAPLPTPTVTSESPRQERKDAGFYAGSSGYFIPTVTMTGEYISRFADRYMGEPIYEDGPRYKEIIK